MLYQWQTQSPWYLSWSRSSCMQQTRQPPTWSSFTWSVWQCRYCALFWESPYLSQWYRRRCSSLARATSKFSANCWTSFFHFFRVPSDRCKRCPLVRQIRSAQTLEISREFCALWSFLEPALPCSKRASPRAWVADSISRFVLRWIHFEIRTSQTSFKMMHHRFLRQTRLAWSPTFSCMEEDYWSDLLLATLVASTLAS